MPSRRRSRSKNLTNNLADVQRRLRFLERRPVRTRLSNRVVTRAALAPNSVSEDEVSFGTAIVVPPGGNINDVIAEVENPKDGLLVVDTDSGSSKVYYEDEETYVDITDPNAQLTAEEAQQAADDAQTAADEAQLAADDALLAADAAADSAALADQAAQGASLSANGKNAVFRQSTEPTQQVNGAPLRVGDIWFDTTAVSKDGFTDSNGSRPRRYAGPGATVDARWPFFGLSYAAITSLDADRITAGVITGRTLQTSASGNRVVISNNDEIIFYDNQGVPCGRVSPYFADNTGLQLIAAEDTFSGPQILLRSNQLDFFQGNLSYISLSMYQGTGIFIQQSTPFGGTQDSTTITLYSGGSTSETSPINMDMNSASWVDWSAGVYENTMYWGSSGISLTGLELNLLGNPVFISGPLTLGLGIRESGTGSPVAYTGSNRFKYDGEIRFRY